MTNSKACNKCKQTLPISAFRKSKNNYRSKCRLCEAEDAREYRKQNPEAQKLADLNYKLKHPEKRKQIWGEYYRKNKEELLAKNKIYRDKNRQKVLGIYKSYRENNKEKIAKAFTKYRLANPDVYVRSQHNKRAKMAGVEVFVISRRDIKKILNSSCTYCGSTKRISVDHVIPISRGGNHSVGNLTAACFSCNSSKNNRFITEWKYYA